MNRSTRFFLLMMLTLLLCGCGPQPTARQEDDLFRIHIVNQSGEPIYGARFEFYLNRTPLGGEEYGSLSLAEPLYKLKAELPASCLPEGDTPHQLGLGVTLLLDHGQREVLLDALVEWSAEVNQDCLFLLQGSTAEGFVLLPEDADFACILTPWANLPPQLLPPEQSPLN